jgi:hypothetical protein
MKREKRGEIEKSSEVLGSEVQETSGSRFKVRNQNRELSTLNV